MTKYAWKVDEKEIRADVKDNLPEDWGLEVFQVTSGDTGKKYWVQVMTQNARYTGPGLPSKNEPIFLCDCPEGKFKAPLLIIGLQEFMCKHARVVEEIMV